MSSGIICHCGVQLGSLEQLPGTTAICPSCGAGVPVPRQDPEKPIDDGTEPVIEVVADGRGQEMAAAGQRSQPAKVCRAPARRARWPWAVGVSLALLLLLAAGAAYTWAKWFSPSGSPSRPESLNWFVYDNTAELTLSRSEMQRGLVVLVMEMRFPSETFGIEDDTMTDSEDVFHEHAVLGSRLLEQQSQNAFQLIASDASTRGAERLTCKLITSNGSIILPYGDSVPRQAKHVDVKFFVKMQRRLAEAGGHQFRYLDFPPVEAPADLKKDVNK